MLVGLCMEEDCRMRGVCVGVLVSDQYSASANEDSVLLLLGKEVDRSVPSPCSLADSP